MLTIRSTVVPTITAMSSYPRCSAKTILPRPGTRPACDDSSLSLDPAVRIHPTRAQPTPPDSCSHRNWCRAVDQSPRVRRRFHGCQCWRGRRDAALSTLDLHVPGPEWCAGQRRLQLCPSGVGLRRTACAPEGGCDEGSGQGKVIYGTWSLLLETISCASS